MPVALLSTSPERDDTILMKDSVRGLSYASGVVASARSIIAFVTVGAEKIRTTVLPAISLRRE